jgi:sugar phosphate isomerase/epimerase
MQIAFDPYSGTLQLMKRDQVFEEVAKAGYEGLDLLMASGFVDGRNEADIAHMIGLAKKHRLAVPVVCYGPHTVTTPGMEKQSQETMDICLHVVKKFNAPVILIWPNMPKNATKPQALETLERNLREMAPKAAKEGRIIALEFEKNCPLDNYREGVEFIRKTGLKVTLCADTYHMWNDQADPYAAALAMKGVLGTVHISASDRGEPGNPNDKFDYKTFMRGLREIGYNETLAAQYKLTDIASLKRAADFMKKLVAGLG